MITSSHEKSKKEKKPSQYIIREREGEERERDKI